jgi:hypothetical protein
VIGWAEKDVHWEEGFMKAQLCLLLKVEGLPRADQFRPTSIRGGLVEGAACNVQRKID